MKFKKLMYNGVFRTIVRLAAAFAAGALLAEPVGTGAAMYVDVALTGAVGLQSAAAIFAGCLVRSAAKGDTERNMIRLAAELMIIAGRLFFEPAKPRSRGVLT